LHLNSVVSRRLKLRITLSKLDKRSAVSYNGHVHNKRLFFIQLVIQISGISWILFKKVHCRGRPGSLRPVD
ncbi:hypothetical protein L9F63_010676, partial [Diploptera punctata]